MNREKNILRLPYTWCKKWLVWESHDERMSVIMAHGEQPQTLASWLFIPRTDAGGALRGALCVVTSVVLESQNARQGIRQMEVMGQGHFFLINFLSFLEYS